MSMSSRRTLALAAVVGLIVPAVAVAQSPSAPTPDGYRPGTVSLALEPFAEGLASPVALTPDGTGSGILYVVEQGGTVRAIASDGTVSADPFLDITDRVTSGGEQGLLGLAFHPDYATNGRLFVYYTANGGSSQVVSEFHATDGIGDPASERLFLDMPDFAENHNGGMLAFDHEGMLLIGTGDGGGGGDPEGNGQDDTQLLGKLLRIDVDGDEPFAVPANDPDGRLGAGVRPEIRATRPAEPVALQRRPDHWRRVHRGRGPGRLGGGRRPAGWRGRPRTSAGPSWRVPTATKRPTATAPA